MNSFDSIGRSFLRVECVNSSMTGIGFSFDEYLNNGDIGVFEYRIDGGDVYEVRKWQDGSSVYLFHSPEEITDSANDIRRILAGNTVAVRATGYDGDRSQAEYPVTALRGVLSQVGCAY